VAAVYWFIGGGYGPVVTAGQVLSGIRGRSAIIAIEATVREGWVRVSVADRGPGIPPEYRRTLFHRFVPPSPGVNEAQYGTGLGLSVVKAIVEAHGGHVGVDDRPGGGARLFR
jgi:signal transduction histidine kinase